ncbi:hypothetical protein GCM10010277_50980 [Streptomyces longisporoflavus]|uniref:hypothetical protein n=1 Tax=Streptomyces longisporoflavus TaxID=28044 RepID=UPI00167DDB6D|nr:hypothetical protein [Streptomyces longisporoflavus]GGV53426.1 hypothetical protein GCM10010277_50980 [Streptomyces longisporoflavus]
MKYDILQILGALVLCFSAQGLIRLLIDHDDAGLLGWLPGGFALLLVAYVVVVAAGLLLTGWSHTQAKALGRRD